MMVTRRQHLPDVRWSLRRNLAARVLEVDLILTPKEIGFLRTTRFTRAPWWLRSLGPRHAIEVDSIEEYGAASVTDHYRIVAGGYEYTICFLWGRRWVWTGDCDVPEAQAFHEALVDLFDSPSGS